MTRRQEDRIQENPRNPLYSAILKRKKRKAIPVWKERLAKKPKETNYSRTTQSFKQT